MATSTITAKGYASYDTGALAASSSWVDTNITAAELRKWHFVVLSTVVSNNDYRNTSSITVPVEAVLSGSQWETPFSFDGTLVAVMRYHPTLDKLQYNTGTGGWKCRIILCR